MSKLKIMAAAIVTTTMMTGSAFAQGATQREDVGGWIVETRSRPGEEIDPLCVLSSPTVEGMFIRFHNPRGAGPTVRGQGVFQVFTDRIISDQDKLVLPQVSIRIDRTERWKKDVGWSKYSETLRTLTVVLDDKIDALIGPFATGREVEVVVSAPDGKEHSFAVKLTGSYRAFALYEKCLAKVRVAPD